MKDPERGGLSRVLFGLWCRSEETMDRSKVFDAIDSERDYQDRKWGTPAEHPHEVAAHPGGPNVGANRP